MTEWNLADCLDIVTDLRGARPALIQGNTQVSWKEFRAHAESIACWLVDAGARQASKVALYTYNDIAYLEATYACLQASMVPVNINYRYQTDELRYLLENSDAEAILIHEDFLQLLAEVLPDQPQLKAVILLGSPKIPQAFDDIAVSSYGEIISEHHHQLNEQRSSNDLILIYTGGTTGMPKGVMWRQGDIYYSLAGGTGPAPESAEAFHRFILEDAAPLRALVLPPLMHATAFFAALTVLLAGGTVILSANPRKFDPIETLNLIELHRPNALSIVGDVFAQPILDELDRHPYDISSLESIHSAGALWSQKVKARIIEHHPDITLVDGLGSTEAHSIGASVTTRDNVAAEAPVFTFGVNTVLVDKNLAPLPREPGQIGMIAVGGRRPLGYYKDIEKSGEIFIHIDGKAYTLSGDWAQINEDRESFALLGRGSMCINSGGEKVHPEEVENVIKQFPAVIDTLVVGIPSEKWGESVAAIVKTDSNVLDTLSLTDFLRTRLAGYKTPRHILQVDNVFRSPSGKADYPSARQFVMDQLVRHDT